MKKMLLVGMLLLLCKGAHAQFAALELKNYNSVCTVYVDVYAVDANLSCGTACDIRTCTFILPPSTTTGFAFANPVAVFPITGPGYCTNACGFNPGTLATDLASMSPGWVWTDASFQYDCSPSDCGTGGSLSEAFPGACPNSCLSASTSWTPVTCSPPVTNATWTSPGNCLMNDVLIEFW